jgi:cell division protein FtsI (penicillin-binding protein 3)
MALLLVGRVLALQVLDLDHGYEFLQDQGAARAVRLAEIPAYRGMIADRRGEPLAVSTPVMSIAVNPRHLQQARQAAAAETAAVETAAVETAAVETAAVETAASATLERRLAELAAVLDIPTGTLEAKLLRHAGKQFIYLKRRVVPALGRKVLDLRVPGISGQREYRRFYPAGEVAAQLVGMTNIDDEGIAGLELAYNDWLRGVPGKKRFIKDLRGGMVREIGEVQAARPGNDLRLSIDLRLQYQQHQALQRAVALSGAVSASVVTLDSRTGEVLAMVNHPVFNPNSRQQIQPGHTRNRAMTDVIEPGSTVKPLTLVAALESGRYRTDTLIDTSPGRITVGRKVIPDPRDYGEISVSRVIEKSSQVGITKMALDIGHQPIWNVFNRFGLGQAAGTGFPGESAGLLPNRARWYLTEQVTLAYGYGLTATPLQLARAYAVFASGGLLHPISLLALDAVPADSTRVLEQHIARQVLDVLHAVTGEHGTAGLARVPGYPVGGKTGTVHKVGPGGYQDDRYVALFAGVAPIDDPRFVTVVVLDEPKGDAHGGGAAAAPVFSAVAGSVLALLNVAPDEAAIAASLEASRKAGAAS